MRYAEHLGSRLSNGSDHALGSICYVIPHHGNLRRPGLLLKRREHIGPIGGVYVPRIGCAKSFAPFRRQWQPGFLAQRPKPCFARIPELFLNPDGIAVARQGQTPDICGAQISSGRRNQPRPDQIGDLLFAGSGTYDQCLHVPPIVPVFDAHDDARPRTGDPPWRTHDWRQRIASSTRWRVSLWLHDKKGHLQLLPLYQPIHRASPQTGIGKIKFCRRILRDNHLHCGTRLHFGMNGIQYIRYIIQVDQPPYMLARQEIHGVAALEHTDAAHGLMQAQKEAARARVMVRLALFIVIRP
jgi:hypothetical protein